MDEKVTPSATTTKPLVVFTCPLCAYQASSITRVAADQALADHIIAAHGLRPAREAAVKRLTSAFGELK